MTFRAYGRLLGLLRGRDPQEHREIREDAECLLNPAHARGRGAFAATWLALMWDLIVGAASDVGRALRSLVRAPGFSVTVSLLFGVGVAATTTLFALVNAVILKPLPYADPDRLVMVWESNVPQNRPSEGPASRIVPRVSGRRGTCAKPIVACAFRTARRATSDSCASSAV